jgi:DNA-binding transcriptional ArsR family regulator
MRLFYHDHTPIDYEPPMFKAGSEAFPIGIVPIQLGKVETAHHEIRLQVATKCKQGQDEVEMNLIPASQDMELSQNQAENNVNPSADLEKSLSTATQLIESPARPALQEDKVSELFNFSEESQKIQEHETIANSQPGPIQEVQIEVACACHSIRNKYLIQCTSCSLYSHFPCYGYTSVTDPRYIQFTRLQGFLCYDCDSKPLIPVSEFTSLAQKRFTFYQLKNSGTVGSSEHSASVNLVEKLTGLSRRNAGYALRSLRETGLVVMEGKKSVVADPGPLFCTELNYGAELPVEFAQTSRDSGVGLKRHFEEDSIQSISLQDDFRMPHITPKRHVSSQIAKKRKVSVVQQDLAVL